MNSTWLCMLNVNVEFQWQQDEDVKKSNIFFRCVGSLQRKRPTPSQIALLLHFELTILWNTKLCQNNRKNATSIAIIMSLAQHSLFICLHSKHFICMQLEKGCTTKPSKSCWCFPTRKNPKPPPLFLIYMYDFDAQKSSSQYNCISFWKIVVVTCMESRWIMNQWQAGGKYIHGV